MQSDDILSSYHQKVMLAGGLFVWYDVFMDEAIVLSQIGGITMQQSYKQEFFVQVEGNEFWQYSDNTDESQEVIQINKLDEIANGFKWSMAVKGTKQRVRHSRSVMTNSIAAMLDYVKAELQADANAKVYCITPDVEVCFTC